MEPISDALLEEALPADIEVRIRQRAMSLLAAREHSRAELRGKLLQRFNAGAVIDDVIDRLAAEGLQSDERFIEAFIASRTRRGQGPVRIRGELQQRGIDKALTSRYLDRAGVDWRELAERALQKKYGPPSDEGPLKARQIRFLQYRGFTHDQIQSLWRFA